MSSGLQEKILTIAPPPTPNGGLHLGHLSGPYLAADIFKRLLEKRGAHVVYAVSTDDHQTYVDRKAIETNTTAEFLIEGVRKEILEALDSFNISVDLYGEQDGNYLDAVETFFNSLYLCGALTVKDVPVLYNKSDNTYPVESFVSGYCSNCLAETCGGICEACGHPNNGYDLHGIEFDDHLVTLVEPRLVLDLESCRGDLVKFCESLVGVRPSLKALISQILGKPLPECIISYKSNRGIKLPDIPGLEGQVLNVWAEMYVGHMYFLSSAAKSEEIDQGWKYVQFMGFDNSFFYVFMHAAIGIKARKVGLKSILPSSVYTNQFYLLNGEKFSTSRGHLIWATEFSREYNTDLFRFYACLYGSELQESSFDLNRYEDWANQLSENVNMLCSVYEERSDSSMETIKEMERVFPADLIGSISSIDPETYLMSDHATKSFRAFMWFLSQIENGNGKLIDMIPMVLKELFYPYLVEFIESVDKVVEGQGAKIMLPRLGVKK